MYEANVNSNDVHKENMYLYSCNEMIEYFENGNYSLVIYVKMSKNLHRPR